MRKLLGEVWKEFGVRLSSRETTMQALSLTFESKEVRIKKKDMGKKKKKSVSIRSGWGKRWGEETFFLGKKKNAAVSFESVFHSYGTSLFRLRVLSMLT